MEYCSTRNEEYSVSAAQAILKGLAPDGGLFVPKSLPTLDIKALAGKSYEEIGAAVLGAFLTDYDPAFLKEALRKSYSANFDGKAGYYTRLADDLYCLELWHGPTAAFKDYALQLMPKLLVEARRMLGETGETYILVATSGDTGGAALKGYAGMDGIKIAAFYPENGTSEVQRLQMVTQEGENVSAWAVKGNFDDAQKGVKQAFTSTELAEALAKKNIKLSSANSINWGRLVPQLVYYISTYLGLCAQGAVTYGQPVDYYVPSGNFGDIMAGWYAKQLGLPVGRLVCASNKNNVLADFLKTGHYDSKREFYKTSSPSMDILVSSNLERLLWHASGDSVKVRGWMQQLAETGEYTVDADTLANIQKDFAGGWTDEDAVYAELRHMFEEYDYLCDPHTAVAFKVLADKRAEAAAQNGGAANPAVVLSTASPYKFVQEVLQALGHDTWEEEFKAIAGLERYTGTKAPQNLTGLAGKEIRFTAVIEPGDIPGVPLKM